MICLFGLYRSGDCSRSLPRRQFHTTALFSGQNRPRLGRESWIPSVVPKMRSRPLSRFAKINYPIIFPRHNFFSKIREKRGKFKPCRRFDGLLRRKGFNVIKLCIVRAILGSQAQALEPSNLVALENKYLGPWAPSIAHTIYNH